MEVSNLSTLETLFAFVWGTIVAFTMFAGSFWNYLFAIGSVGGRSLAVGSSPIVVLAAVFSSSFELF